MLLTLDFLVDLIHVTLDGEEISLDSLALLFEHCVHVLLLRGRVTIDHVRHLQFLQQSVKDVLSQLVCLLLLLCFSKF
jgi:hypothetical protein